MKDTISMKEGHFARSQMLLVPLKKDNLSIKDKINWSKV